MSRAVPQAHSCVVCRAVADFVCSLCEEVWYCGEAHQKLYWSTHKTECSARRQVSDATQLGADLQRRNAVRQEAVQLLERGEVREALNRALEGYKITFSLLGGESFDLMPDYLLLIDIHQKFKLPK